MQNKKTIIILTLLTMVLVLPSIMAATTLNVPVTGTNYTSITFNCTTTLAECGACLNATVWYNASGGAAEPGVATLLGVIANGSANDVDFTSAISIESLSDAATYNFTCSVSNESNTYIANSSGVQSVGIDNTDSTYTFTLSKPTRADFKGTQKLTWTTTDATSGVETVSVTVTSPNTDTCPTQTWTTTSGTDTDVELDCAGDYTAAMTVVDNAGNSVSTSDEFTVYAPGYKTTSEAGTSFGTFSIGGDGEAKANLKTLAVITIIILGIWFLAKK